ncbi:hypothetical protein [Methanosphaera cuniculi]|nr:hypothetical protein [Methanosphaera cuniculi]
MLFSIITLSDFTFSAIENVPGTLIIVFELIIYGYAPCNSIGTL